jgi:hypothetical protein
VRGIAAAFTTRIGGRDMGLRYREHHKLRRVQRALRESDPHLCSMLAIFSRLAVGECMPAWERIPESFPHALLASIGSAAVLLAGSVLLACGRAARRTARCGLAGLRFLATGARLVASLWLSGHSRPVPSAGLTAGDAKN